MIALPPGTKVFLACQPIDLRAGFDGLAAKAQQIIGADPFSGHVFIFRSKRGQRATFCIRFSIRDDRIPLASAIWAHLPGVAVSARQGVDVHLYG
jgi:transposase